MYYMMGGALGMALAAMTLSALKVFTLAAMFVKHSVASVFGRK
jgi:hypothetical protein